MLGEITARNYAAQAVAGLAAYERHLPGTPPFDIVGAKLLSAAIDSAVHFAIPDFGRILDCDLKGISGQRLHLPFPMVSIEFFVPVVLDRLTDETPVYSPKRVVSLSEMSRDEIVSWRSQNRDMCGPGDAFPLPIPNPDRLEGGGFIHISAACEIDGVWRAMAATWLLPVENWEAGEYGADKAIRGELGILMPDYVEELVKKYGADYARKTITIDISPELRAALEFIEACSCANIVPVTRDSGAPPNVNARRRRDGKLPIYETKVLTVDPAWLDRHRKEREELRTTDRVSPRQHLRRGHFRRLDWNTRFARQIWIPPTIVGDIERGRIDKSYKIGK